MEKTLIVLLLVLFAIATAQKGKIKLNLPKQIHKPFSWKLKPLTGGGKLNGLSGTGIWKPPNTGNTFTGTGSWQSGKGFGGSLKGTFGTGGGSSVSFGVAGGGGKAFKASIGFRMKFKRKRRSVIARELFEM
ncbi:uncharacterized protein LOC128547043 [Mercenaria mercenaria]|uniref:uncharacterized protein LOC128547043 n=1 Tax=Mercenaria mercenaria TaxID=6596 RepID=UPI00234F36B1|nr:uncharacterized protein LOC128547043 [Mercenaria mercenaria]